MRTTIAARVQAIGNRHITDLVSGAAADGLAIRRGA